MKRSLSIETKMIIGAISVTLLMVGWERYYFSENIVQQFIESKKSKNRLLIETISPIVGLNMALGLDDANKEYLDQIVKQNRDLHEFELVTPDGKLLYRYSKNTDEGDLSEPETIANASKTLKDPVSGETLGKISISLDDHEYQTVLAKNRQLTINTFVVVIIVLILYIVFIRREFRHLNLLSFSVKNYDPKKNNFTLQASDRKDEVGIIHNAIVEMVDKIRSHSQEMDDINRSLEEKIALRTLELEQANKRLTELSLTDPLTQLSNRRHFQNRMNDIWEAAKRDRTEIALIMCDIDYFKAFNDTFGHLLGDTVLKEIARILKDTVKRSTDFVARYGGEEFIIVLYDGHSAIAETFCEQVQSALKNRGGFEFHDTLTPPVTMSFGIAYCVPELSETYENFIHRADTALYQAKEQGRNRIVRYGK